MAMYMWFMAMYLFATELKTIRIQFVADPQLTPQLAKGCGSGREKNKVKL